MPPRARTGGKKRSRPSAAPPRGSTMRVPRPREPGGTPMPFDFSQMALKADHANRPFWVLPNGVIVLEAFNRFYEQVRRGGKCLKFRAHATPAPCFPFQARDFLIAICEPRSRPDLLHEYVLDKNALFAAASMGLTAELVLTALARLSKAALPPGVQRFVRLCTTGYGKVKLVLERSRYYVESAYPDILRLLAAHPSIAAARVARDGTAAFTSASARAEAADSLGLRGIVAAEGAGAAAAAVDTAGGLLSARVSGEVEDGGREAAAAADDATELSTAPPPTAGSEAEDAEYLAAIFGAGAEEPVAGWSASLAAARAAVAGSARKARVAAAVAVARRLPADGVPLGAVPTARHVSTRGRAVAVKGAQNLAGLHLESSSDDGAGSGQDDASVASAPSAASVSSASSGSLVPVGGAEEEEGGVDVDGDYDDDLAVDNGEEVLLSEEEEPAPPTRRAPKAPRRRPGEDVGDAVLAALPAAAAASWATLQRKAAVAAAAPLRGAAARRVLRFEIRAAAVEEVRRVALGLEPPYPMMHEYDFRADTLGVPLDASLRRPEQLRPYQAKSLAKMYGNGRARSGIIVLPCGAGKTLVGIAAVCTMGRSALVFCPNSTSVEQWVGQFKAFTTIPSSLLIKLTAKHKQALPPPSVGCVVLTTYHMVAAGGKRAAATEALLRDIGEREWGLALLDEVHQAVADKFSRVLKLRCHCRLGLTATLVREDGRDRELAYMIGPKLYEANWQDLTKAGHLANVQVVEVWCPMAPAFYREYLAAPSAARRKALATMNPAKCFAMHRLLELHKARAGDKIIVFSESVYALELYARKFDAPFITGATPERDRAAYIRAFRDSDSVNMLFLTRVGDVALDVPDANVIIQISSHYGSRLQEAQRLGRILRKGRQFHAASAFNAFFYTLISTDTSEVFFSNKRRRYLVDQGYAYKVVHAVGAGGKGLAPSMAALAAGCPYMVTAGEQEAALRRVLEGDVEGAERGENSALAAVADEGATAGGFVARLEAAARMAAGAAAGAGARAAPPPAKRSIGAMRAWSTPAAALYTEVRNTDRITALAASEAEAAAQRRADVAQAGASAGVGAAKPRPAPSYIDGAAP